MRCTAGPALEAFRDHTFPPSDREVMAGAPRNDAKAAHWFEHELRQYPAVELDLAALRAYADRIVLAAGRDGPARWPCRLRFAPEEFALRLVTALERTGAPIRQSPPNPAGSDTHHHPGHHDADHGRDHQPGHNGVTTRHIRRV